MNAESVFHQAQALGGSWHAAGTVDDAVLAEFYRLGCERRWQNTMETGCGRTTLLLSHLSAKHTVFAVRDERPDRIVDDSLPNVEKSELLNKATTHFVVGPTQLTLPKYDFAEQLDLVLLDGPHAYPFPELEYYFVYPHIRAGGTLVVDDIHIPTIHHLFSFLREEPMFTLEKVVSTTAFFRRTDAPLFSPTGDDWDRQPFNTARFPAGVPRSKFMRALAAPLRALPAPVRTFLKKAAGR